jgi:hypothetical protein
MTNSMQQHQEASTSSMGATALRLPQQSTGAIQVPVTMFRQWRQQQWRRRQQQQPLTSSSSSSRASS